MEMEKEPPGIDRGGRGIRYSQMPIKGLAIAEAIDFTAEPISGGRGEKSFESEETGPSCFGDLESRSRDLEAVADFVSVGGDGGRREAEGGRVDLEIGEESSIIWFLKNWMGCLVGGES
ncbi:hypothetical protein LXL04_035695 [Taraxacum kok-saghyz]